MLLPITQTTKKINKETEKKRFKPLIHTLIKFCFKIIKKKLKKSKDKLRNLIFFFSERVLERERRVGNVMGLVVHERIRDEKKNWQ